MSSWEYRQDHGHELVTYLILSQTEIRRRWEDRKMARQAKREERRDARRDATELSHDERHRVASDDTSPLARRLQDEL